MPAAIVSIYSKRWGPFEELGPAYVVASLSSAGIEARILSVSDDLEDSFGTTIAEMVHLKPVLVGIACSHAAIPIAVYRRISAAVRQAVPTCHITCGGYWASFNGKRLLDDWPELDSVVVGEGEATMVDLYHHLQSRRGRSIPGLLQRHLEFTPRPPTHNLDLLPFPHRSSSATPSALISIATSRGCVAQCTFCNVPRWTTRYGGGWRGRSPGNVVTELEQLTRKGSRRFWFVDSSFEDPMPTGLGRMRSIAELIISRGLDITFYVFFRAETFAHPEMPELMNLLVESGLRRIFLGVESGTPEHLKLLHKPATLSDICSAITLIRECRVALRCGFIMFLPCSTVSTLRTNMEFLAANGLLHSTVDLTKSLELYTGAVETGRLERKGMVQGDVMHDPYGYSFADPAIGRFAVRMRQLRETRSTDYRWEALHNGELLLKGAWRDERVSEHSSLRALRDELQCMYDALSKTLAASNRQFFLSCLSLLEGGEREAEFEGLIRDFIDGNHLTVSQTIDQMSTLFIAEAKRAGVSIRY